MPILLYRVDERLIHGQVVVGWGSQLRPDRYLVVDGALAESEWEQELYTLGVPEGVTVEFLSPTEARELLPAWREADRRSVLLTRDLGNMLELARGGAMAGEAVNLGGLHSQRGRDEVLSYLFLDDSDRETLKALAEEAVDISARDLPGSPKVGLESLLG
jgi:PTS system mannose-specific IIB component/fructoselysine and glucoselysine-specific PTS system IIB component